MSHNGIYFFLPKYNILFMFTFIVIHLVDDTNSQQTKKESFTSLKYVQPFAMTYVICHNNYMVIYYFLFLFFLDFFFFFLYILITYI